MLVLGTRKTDANHFAFGKSVIVRELGYSIYMDGVAMTDDDTNDEHTVDLSLCLSLILSLYCVYNTEYPTEL